MSRSVHLPFWLDETAVSRVHFWPASPESQALVNPLGTAISGRPQYPQRKTEAGQVVGDSLLHYCIISLTFLSPIPGPPMEALSLRRQ